MTKIYSVRHGEAAAGWDQDLDPPLSPLGYEQARVAAQTLTRIVANPKTIQCISSPIKRAHQTAQAFAELIQKEIIIEHRVAEIPSPISEVQKRMPWLKSVMQDSWPNLSPELNLWRNNCINYIKSLENDCVIFSHYIAINVLIGHCQNNNAVINFHPDNCSIHQFEMQKGKLQLVQLGEQAKTKIN